MALMTKLINSEPSKFEEVAQHDVWQEAMVEEYDSIMKNQVWEVVLRLEGKKKVVGSRWIYKVKHAADKSMEKYKVHFMAKGFSQEGINYEETFAPVARYSSILTIISLAVEMGWRVHQMDAKTAFLNGVTEEEVYIV